MFYVKLMFGYLQESVAGKTLEASVGEQGVKVSVYFRSLGLHFSCNIFIYLHN